MSVIEKRNRLGNEVKRAKRLSDDASEERVIEARRELAAAKLEKYVEAVVAASPPLSPDQLHRLARILRGQAS